MITIKRKTLFYWFFIIFFSIGFLLPWIKTGPGVKLGEDFIPCNPKAKIDPKKIYHLRLWDYNWPMPQGKSSYRNYLLQVIKNFQEIYPNVKVEIKLLDLNRSAELIQALNKNEAPDIYCSAYTIPGFNIRKQIPVGPYLNKLEQDSYFSNVKNPLTYHQVLCYFPRWIGPEFWIGNRSMIEASGLSVSKIQTEGWTWNELISLNSNPQYHQYILTGNLGPNGLLSQLIANAGQGSEKANLTATLDLIENLRNKKAIPTNFGYNMLGRFLNKNAIILAGLRPPIYKLLLNKMQNQKMEWQAVLLPVPSKIRGKNTVILENSVISIYRNRFTKGNDHLAAAVKFGRYLSCYPDITPWEYLGFCPASREPCRIWIKRAYPNEQLYNKLVFGQSLFDDYITFKSEPGNILFMINDFMTGKTSKQEILSNSSM
jgi:hypothetical protein